jgi:hypothetical protein
MQVSFLELVAQLFCELDFGIAREAGRRLCAGIGSLRSKLDHGNRTSRISRAKTEMSCENRLPMVRSDRVGDGQCKNSQQHGTHFESPLASIGIGARNRRGVQRIMTPSRAESALDVTRSRPSSRLNDVDLRDLVVVER